jgi:hypothetical protein
VRWLLQLLRLLQRQLCRILHGSANHAAVQPLPAKQNKTLAPAVDPSEHWLVAQKLDPAAQEWVDEACSKHASVASLSCTDTGTDT